MHVVVVTVAHRGDDARIVHRQARSLLEAGHRVTLVAPLPPGPGDGGDPRGLVRRAVPRAVGRRRIGAWRAARRAVREIGDADVVLLHDPELVPLFARRRPRVPVAWDVHEDFLASVGDRRWIPAPVRSVVSGVVRAIEGGARRRCHLLLAEDAYAARFPGAPVVPNSTWVPPAPAPLDPGTPRVVYVGRISRGRGAEELVALGRALAGVAEVVLVGDADPDVHGLVASAAAAGAVRWTGFLANPEAMAEVRGALAGLSLLHDEPNYRHSRPTKVVEYLAQGVPVVTTPLPLAVEVVQGADAGVVVPHGPVDEVVAAVAEAVRRWSADPAERDRAGARGHAAVLARWSWQADGARFVALLEGWASPAGQRRPCAST